MAIPFGYYYFPNGTLWVLGRDRGHPTCFLPAGTLFWNSRSDKVTEFNGLNWTRASEDQAKIVKTAVLIQGDSS